MSQQNHPLSHMLATNYAGGFQHAAAAANFSNQAHNYNVSANTPLSNGGGTNTSNGGATGVDIPFMYFTPRDAIKFKKAKQKHTANMGLMIQQQ